MACATGSLTAPCSRISVAGTPSICDFASFEYVTKPRSNHADAPGMSVMAAPTSPAVHDSAVATIRLRLCSVSPTSSASCASARDSAMSFSPLESRQNERHSANTSSV